METSKPDAPPIDLSLILSILSGLGFEPEVMELAIEPERNLMGAEL